jgi:hypothetical protein
MQARIRQFDVGLRYPKSIRILNLTASFCSQVDENRVRCLKHLSSKFYSFA